jgi:radical SAM protein with 4Fe4S-binding SPASM domain
MILVAQWHITEECNWRCTHCYHDSYLDKWPSLDKLKEIFIEFLCIKNNFFWILSWKRLNIAWWEPFVRPDFIELLEFINSTLEWVWILDIWIMTNWSYMTQEIIDKLKSLKNINFFYQISIEWREKINDSIRWPWSFKKIVNAIKLAKLNDLKLSLSCTLHKENKNEVFKMLDFVKSNEVFLKVRRLVPMGQTKWEYNLMLEDKEWYEFTKRLNLVNLSIKKEWSKWKFILNWCSEITASDYDWEWCWINSQKALTIMHDLKVYSCRRLFIPIWDLNENSLNEIYNSEEYKKHINVYKDIEVCNKCSFKEICKWWAKCITYHRTWKLNLPDPQCYYAKLLKIKYKLN